MLCVPGAWAQNMKADTAPNAADTVVLFRTVPQNAFSVGEKIRMSVRYGPIPCGELTFNVAEMTTHQGRPVYVVHVYLATNRAFSFLYEVSDTLTSYIDAEGMFTWRMTKEIHEKKINDPRQDTVEIYDYDQMNRTWSKNGEVKGEILPFTQDVLSSIYYLRAIDWSGSGDTVRAPLNDWRRNYMMTFELGPTRRLSVLNEWVQTRTGKPMVQLEGKYKMIGNNEVWFTDDIRRIPVQVRCNIKLGSLYARVVEYVPGRPRLAKTDTPGQGR